MNLQNASFVMVLLQEISILNQDIYCSIDFEVIVYRDLYLRLDCQREGVQLICHPLH